MSDNSKRFTSLALSTVLLIGFLATDQSGIHSPSKATRPAVKSSSSPKASVEAKKGRSEYFFNMLRDPATNSIPEGIRQRELAFARTLDQRPPVLGKVLGPADGIAFDWKEVGPNDVGGRTRALAIDHTNSNTIIAGGVSGGIWKSTDGGQTWTLKTAMNVPLGVTWIAQDPRSGQNNTWYYTSGEFRGDSAGDRGGVAFFYGTGVYKSTDNGETWSKLESTLDSDPLRFTGNFDFVSKIIIHPTSGNLYVATNGFGIFRSTDGGTSFSLVLGKPAEHRWTDIAVSSNGTLLATLSESVFFGPTDNPGVYRSTDDGDNWTDITPDTFPATHARSVIGMAPSNPDVAYIFTYDDTKSGDREDVHLFKVTSIAGSTFSDLSTNLPDFGGDTGFLNTQDSYNMTVAVKPDDSDFVLIGGTSLYRSTNGFSTQITSADSNWVGGYTAQGASAPGGQYAKYPNHHPDQHVAVFDPNNTGVLWSGHDGGISRAADATASPMAWESMNNAYNVTQFYHVSIAAEAGNTRIVGGTQDNGSPAFDWNAPNDGSTDLSSGDGAYSYTGSQFVYTSFQVGNVFRYTTSGNFEASLKPDGTSGQLFIHPFTVDPTDESIMYYPLANVLMRNNTIDTAVSGNGWATLSNIAGPAGTNISALAVSTSNPAHRLYFAASGDGSPNIYSLDNADSATDGAVDISIPGLDNGSYVHNIAVNPNSADEIIVVMSNYNIVGLYHSNDGGANYTAVEGNLEGTDDGPSLRWGAILPIDSTAQYLVGTSIGLFSTAVLNGSSTSWTQEGAAVIGNVTVAALAARTSDNTVAAATHGRGIFIGEGPQTGPSPILNTVAQIEFGDVLVGSSVTDSAKVKNTGTADLSVSTVAVTGADSASFVATPLSLSVPAGDSAYVQITFTPGSLGAKSAALELTHNAGGSPTSISFSGTGVFPGIVAATSLPIGDVLVGSSATDSAKVKNTGNTTLSVSAMTVTGADSALFAAAPAAFSVSAGDSAYVKVTFTPASVGAKTASLQLTHNAAGSPTAITLTGTGGQSVADLADTLSFTSDDGSNTKVKFESGTITGVSVSHQNHGRNLPSGMSSDSAPTTPVLYFEINTTLPDTATFTAVVSIKYTQAMLDSANVTDETTLKLFRFDAGGGVWTQLVTVVDTSANTATATTSSFSVWGLGSATPTGIEMENEAKALPNSFALHHARPNPFNPSTTIAYEVPEQTHITLTIYNLLGQEVVRLVDQVQAAGRYEVVWNGINTRGAGVASGIYLYRITSGSGYNETKRMTLLK